LLEKFNHGCTPINTDFRHEFLVFALIGKARRPLF
jgi:hypothetical protein